MKTLFLVRHAKSSWGDPSLDDRSRPLAARGERDSATMGKRLSQRHVRPDLIVSSPAVRALSTARVIAKALDYKPKDIVVDARLYAATADVQIAVIEALDAAVGCVMLVGHNPEFTELVHRSSSEITGMPTCAVAEFEFKVKTWKGIGRTRPVSFGLRLSDEQGRLGRQAGSIVGTECSVRPGRV
jgi:phosphohistidine phosphatase